MSSLGIINRNVANHIFPRGMFSGPLLLPFSFLFEFYFLDRFLESFEHHVAMHCLLVLVGQENKA